MAEILKILQSEYNGEYKSEYNLKKYSTPRIYPKIVTSKPISAFTDAEKKAILSKYKRWYIYYSFDHPTNKTKTGLPQKIKQAPIYFNINRDYPDFDERLKHFKIVRNSVERLLKDGHSPYESENNTNEYSVINALDYALEIKKKEVKETTYSGYETRINTFKKFLNRKRYTHLSIKEINKSIVSEFLRGIKEPVNRNNSKAALSSIFTELSSEGLIDVNFIKEIRNSKQVQKPVKIYTENDVSEISALLAQNDPMLLMFVKLVSYMFWRPIEILRLTHESVDFVANTMTVQTKTKEAKTKIIPAILLEEVKEFCNNKTGFLFKPSKVDNWELSEEDKRKYFTRRFARFRTKHDISSEFKLYSFRHTYITKIYLELRKTYSKFESVQKLSLITGHESKAIYNYIQVNDIELPEDYSDFLLYSDNKPHSATT